MSRNTIVSLNQIGHWVHGDLRMIVGSSRFYLLKWGDVVFSTIVIITDYRTLGGYLV